MTTSTRTSELARETLAATTPTYQVSEVARETLAATTPQFRVSMLVRETLRTPYRYQSIPWRLQW